MSTRSKIAIKKKDGTVEAIYCHSDGYLEYNGVILNNYYKDPNKVQTLINLGDISCLGPKVHPNPELPHSFDYDERQEDVTVAYGRDRGEKEIDKKVFRDLDTFKESLEGTWCEYAYVFDESNSKWFWSVIPYRDESNLNLKDLNDTLLDKKIITKVDDDFDKLIRKCVDFEKDYDTYEFNDVYNCYEDAYFDKEKSLSNKRGLEMEAQVIKDTLSDLEEKSDSKEIKDLIKEGNDLIKSINNFIKEKYNDKDSIEI